MAGGFLLTEAKDALRARLIAARRALSEAESFPPTPEIATLCEQVYAEPLRQQREQLEELRAAIAADPRVANPRHSDS